MCEFSRNRDRLVEGARENNTVNGSSHEVIDVLGHTKIHSVLGSAVKHVKEESLESVQKVEMRGGLDNLLDERSEYAGVTAHEDIAFVNIHRMLELVIEITHVMLGWSKSMKLHMFMILNHLQSRKFSRTIF